MKRQCINPDCLWKGDESDCLGKFCPLCHEVTERLEYLDPYTRETLKALNTMLENIKWHNENEDSSSPVEGEKR